MGGVSPLYVLLTEMRKRWAGKDYDAAVGLAKAAAPYVHGRAVSGRAPDELAGVPDHELDGWGGGGGASAAEEGAGEPR